MKATPVVDIAKVASQSFSLQKAPRFGNLNKYKPIEEIKGIQRRETPPKDFADELKSDGQARSETTSYFTGNTGRQPTRFEQESAPTAPQPAPANEAFRQPLSASFLTQQFANSNSSDLPPHRNFGSQQSNVGIRAYEAVQTGREPAVQSRGGFDFTSGTSAVQAYEQAATPPSFAQAAQSVEFRTPSLNLFA